jgi:hypothetical protein
MSKAIAGEISEKIENDRKEQTNERKPKSRGKQTSNEERRE